MKKIMIALMISLVLTGLFTSCVRQNMSQNNELTITFESSGERIPFAQIQIFDNGKYLQTLKADSTGTLKVDLKRGDYRLDFTDGFLTGSAEVTFPFKSHALKLEPTEVQKGQVGFVKRLRDTVIKTILLKEKSVRIAEFETDRPIQAEGRIWRINGETNSYVSLELTKEDRTTNYLEIVAFEKDINLKAYRTVDSAGNILMQTETYIEKSDDRQMIESTVLKRVGDICQGKSMTIGTDGKIDIWDLIMLLQKFTGSAQETTPGNLGESGDTVIVPPAGPFEITNADGAKGKDVILDKDDKVDINDLLLLLNAYGSTYATINTPFAPVNVSFNPTKELTWQDCYDNDVFDTYKIFSLAASQSVDPASLTPVHSVNKGTTSQNMTGSNQYAGICAYNSEANLYSDMVIVKLLENDIALTLASSAATLTWTLLPETGDYYKIYRDDTLICDTNTASSCVDDTYDGGETIYTVTDKNETPVASISTLDEAVDVCLQMKVMDITDSGQLFQSGKLTGSKGRDYLYEADTMTGEDAGVFTMAVNRHEQLSISKGGYEQATFDPADFNDPNQYWPVTEQVMTFYLQPVETDGDIGSMGGTLTATDTETGEVIARFDVPQGAFQQVSEVSLQKPTKSTQELGISNDNVQLIQVSSSVEPQKACTLTMSLPLAKELEASKREANTETVTYRTILDQIRLDDSDVQFTIKHYNTSEAIWEEPWGGVVQTGEHSWAVTVSGTDTIYALMPEIDSQMNFEEEDMFSYGGFENSQRLNAEAWYVRIYSNSPPRISPYVIKYLFNGYYMINYEFKITDLKGNFLTSAYGAQKVFMALNEWEAGFYGDEGAWSSEMGLRFLRNPYKEAGYGYTFIVDADEDLLHEYRSRFIGMNHPATVGQYMYNVDVFPLVEKDKLSQLSGGELCLVTFIVKYRTAYGDIAKYERPVFYLNPEAPQEDVQPPHPSTIETVQATLNNNSYYPFDVNLEWDIRETDPVTHKVAIVELGNEKGVNPEKDQLVEFPAGSTEGTVSYARYHSRYQGANDTRKQYSLKPDTDYSLILYTVNDEGLYSSTYKTFKTPSLPPEKPFLNVSSVANAITGNTVSLSWNLLSQRDMDQFNRYELHCATGTGAREDSRVITMSFPGIKRFRVTDLVPGTSYQFVLHVFNKNGQSSQSFPLTVRTKDTPVLGDDITISRVDASAGPNLYDIRVYFNDRAFDEEGYRFYVDGSLIETVYEKNMYKMALEEVTLTQQATHLLQIEVFSGPYSHWGEKLFTVQSPPEKPVIQTLKAYPEQVYLQWHSSDWGSINGYTVEYQMENMSTKQVQQVGHSLSATLTGFIPNQAYDIKVKAKNSAGETSSDATRVVTPVYVPQPPTELRAVYVNNDNNGYDSYVYLSWHNDSRVGYYVVERDGTNRIFTNQNYKRDDDIQKGRTYVYSVYAGKIGTAGNSVLSEPATCSVTIPDPQQPLVPPVLEGVYNNRKKTIELEWNAVDSASAYLIKKNDQITRYDGETISLPDDRISVDATYTYAIRSMGADGSVSDWSDPVVLFTQNHAPEIPLLLSPTDEATVSGDGVVFEWETSFDPDYDTVYYELEIQKWDQGQWHDYISYSLSANAITLYDEFESGYWYTWRVRAIDAYDTSSVSEWNTFYISGGSHLGLSNADIPSGQRQFTTRVRADNFEALSGLEMYIEFDPEYVDIPEAASDITAMIQPLGVFNNAQMIAKRLDNVLYLSFAFMNPEGVDIVSEDICEITFESKGKAGTSALVFKEQTQAINRLQQPITIQQMESGQLNFEGDPEKRIILSDSSGITPESTFSVVFHGENLDNLTGIQIVFDFDEEYIKIPEEASQTVQDLVESFGVLEGVQSIIKYLNGEFYVSYAFESPVTITDEDLFAVTLQGNGLSGTSNITMDAKSKILAYPMVVLDVDISDPAIITFE